MTYEAECYARDKPVLAKKLDAAMAENERLRSIAFGAEEEARMVRKATIEECALVADMEEEMEGDPTPEQIAVFTATGGGDFARAVCRATKKSIARRIRALKDKP